MEIMNRGDKEGVLATLVGSALLGGLTMHKFHNTSPPLFPGTSSALAEEHVPAIDSPNTKHYILYSNSKF
eukprot:3728662-Amphidinium_carterae.1